MAKQYKNHTLQEYLEKLSAKTPVPGGGSASALTAALGVSLIVMVANYSKGKTRSKQAEKKISRVAKEGKKIMRQLVRLVDLDAQAYMNVVKTRKASAKRRLAARKQARAVPFKVCQLCYAAVNLTPVLVREGNKNLISDVQVAIDLLFAAFQSALINVKINQ